MNEQTRMFDSPAPRYIASAEQINKVGELGGDKLFAYKLSRRECSQYIRRLLREQQTPNELERQNEAVTLLERREAEGRMNPFLKGLLDAYRKDSYLSPKRVACVLPRRER